MTTWQDVSVDSGGVQLAVRDYGGTGQPIVLVHGHIGNLGNFEALAPLLTPRLRVVAYDQRGHGLSEPGPVSVSAFVDDLAAVVDVLGLGIPVLYGGSFGTLVSLAYIHASGEVAGFVSEDGRVSDFPPEKPDRPFPEGRRILAEDQLAQAAKMFEDYGVTGTATLDRSAVPLEDGTIELLPTQTDLSAKEIAFSQIPVVDAYRACRGPVLFLAAVPVKEDARRARAAEVAALSAAVPMTVRWFRTRHWISADDPQAVADAVVEFVDAHFT